MKLIVNISWNSYQIFLLRIDIYKEECGSLVWHKLLIFSVLMQAIHFAKQV